MPSRRLDRVPGRGSPPDGFPVNGEADLRDLPWELPHRFLGLDEDASDFRTSRVVILPVPYEATTSWGGGTAAGPAAIVEASRFIELFDQELASVPSGVGIHTLPSLELTREGAGSAMEELERSYARIAEAAGDRFVIMLGGEHSISAPAIRGQAARAGERISVLQLDAHADLRAQHEGSSSSHACAMARVLDVADVVGVGIRGISEEEVEVARTSGAVTHVYADHMWETYDWMDRALDALGDPVYLTFDVDFFDPAVMPSTGTPEPGGGAWYPTLTFLRRVFRERRVLACDVVELAPAPGVLGPDFTVAKLIYKMIGYRFETKT